MLVAGADRPERLAPAGDMAVAVALDDSERGISVALVAGDCLELESKRIGEHRHRVEILVGSLRGINEGTLQLLHVLNGLDRGLPANAQHPRLARGAPEKDQLVGIESRARAAGKMGEH